MSGSIVDVVIADQYTGISSGLFGPIFMPSTSEKMYFIIHNGVIDQFVPNNTTIIDKSAYAILVDLPERTLKIYQDSQLLYQSTNKFIIKFLYIEKKFMPKKKIQIISKFEPYRCAIEYIGSFKKYIDHELLLYSIDTDLRFMYDPDTLYVFIQSIPENIISNQIIKNNIYLLNIEQLTREPFKKMLKIYSEKNIPHIDYVVENTQILKTPYVFPYLYNSEVDHLTRLYQSTKKEYNFCHVGGMSPKRLHIIQKLIERGYTVNIVSAWGNNRDKEIAKCEVLLNIHYADDYKIYESIRCDRWAYAGMKIISEDCLYVELNDMTDIIKFSTYDQIISDAIALLINGHWLSQSEYQNTISKISSNRDKIFLDTIEKMCYR